MPQILWKIVIIIFFISANSCIFQQDSPQTKLTKLNVVLVSIDNLRADRMGLYGYSKKTTPYFDQWAKSAQVFENFYSSTSMTVTSEGSVFTGRYPFENGLISYEHTLWPQIDTITSILSKRGYKTLAYGNSDEYIRYPSAKASFNRFFDKYYIFRRMRNERVLDNNNLKQFLDNAGNDNFFIWLPMGTVHSPHGYPFENVFSDKNYKGPLKQYEQFRGHKYWIYKNFLYPITPETNFRNALAHKYLSPQLPTKIPLKTSDLNWLNDRYDDGIIEFDAQFKAVMEIFESRNLVKNTIFVVYSNHGEEFNEHGYFGHLDIYQGNVHTPLVIKTPTMPTAKRHQMLASSVDILPTLLKLISGEFPTMLDGIDLFSEKADARENIFIFRTPLYESLLSFKNKKSIWDDFRSVISTEDYIEPAIITDRYKLIHRRARFILKKYSAHQHVIQQKIDFPEYEMYDLPKDQLEQVNLAFKSKDFANLQKKLNDFEVKMINSKNVFKKSKTSVQEY